MDKDKEFDGKNAEIGYTNPELLPPPATSESVSRSGRISKIVHELWTIVRKADPKDIARGNPY